MKNINRELVSELDAINLEILKLEKKISKNNVNDNRKIAVTNKEYGYEFYIVNADNTRSYVKKENLKSIKQLLQIRYMMQTLKSLKRQKKLIANFISKYDQDIFNSTYKKLGKAKRSVVKPIKESDETYILKWKAKHPAMQNTFPEKGQFLTEGGEYVRSKSEKIIADLLYQKGIPYQYEPELMLGNRRVYPDFVVLNLKERKTIYWEHLGRGDDEEYASTNLYKIHQYETNGYLLGDNLIVTREFRDMPLSIELIMKKLELYDLI